MSDPKYPYETRLNILHRQLEVIDIHKFAETIEFKWFNQTLCKVNDSVVRVGIIEGEYHWHKHDRDEEFFYVMSGRLLIDLEGTLDESKMEPQIVAIGGGGFSAGPENLLLENYVLGLVDKPRPKVCFFPTASGDSEQYLLKFYAAFARLPATANHLPLFRLAVSDLRSYILSQDVVCKCL